MRFYTLGTCNFTSTSTPTRTTQKYRPTNQPTYANSPVQNHPAGDRRAVQKDQRLRQLNRHGQPADGVAPQRRTPLEGVLERPAVESLQQEERRRHALSGLDVEAGAEGPGDVGVSAALGDLPVDGDLGEEVLDGPGATAGGVGRLGDLEDGALRAVGAGADDAEAAVSERLDRGELRQGHVFYERLHLMQSVCLSVAGYSAWILAWTAAAAVWRRLVAAAAAAAEAITCACTTDVVLLLPRC